MARKKANHPSFLGNMYDATKHVAKIALLAGGITLVGTVFGYYLASSRQDPIRQEQRPAGEQLERTVNEKVDCEIKKRIPKNFYPVVFRTTSSPYDLVGIDEEGRSIMLIRQSNGSYSRLEDVQEAERLSFGKEQEKARAALEESQKAETEHARKSILEVKRQYSVK